MKILLRQCVGCREMLDRRTIIRIVKQKNGDIFVDRTGKQDGRGAYICYKHTCLKRAVKTRALDRAFKTEVPKNVFLEIENLLEKL